MIEKVAKAIYDAEDPLSGDHVATVIHMSDHLFWDDRLPGDTDVERQLAAVMVVCRAAARAAIEAMMEPSEAMLEGASPRPKHWSKEDAMSAAMDAAVMVDRAALRSQYQAMLTTALNEENGE